EGGLAQMLEDPTHVVRDGAHDEAVEEGDVPLGTGASQDAAGRQELEVGHRLVESLRPESRILLWRGQRRGDASPAILDRPVDGGSAGLLQAVFHVPDLLGDGGDLRHEAEPSRRGTTKATYHSSENPRWAWGGSLGSRLGGRWRPTEVNRRSRKALRLR